MAKRRRRPKSSAGSAGELTALAFTAPFVIASRMTGMWLNALNPTARGERENARMITEKMEAGIESVAAANRAIARQTVDAGVQMMTGSKRKPKLNVDAVAAAALKPYSRRVKANARRLSKPEP